MPKPPLQIQTTTLWEYPSQSYGDGVQGDPDHPGVTPSFIVWNLLVRYTKRNDLVVDPMAGSGTTLDVARDLGRRALGYDIAPARDDVFRCDARRLPLETGKADFVFVDPPYSDHVRYSGLPDCIGELSAGGREYYEAMDRVIAEIDRVLRPGRYMALFVCDSARKGRPLFPIGFELFSLLERRFAPVDIVAVVRHNAALSRRRWHTEAARGNTFLRGFGYLFIMFKPDERRARGGRSLEFPDRRDPDEVAELIGRLGDPSRSFSSRFAPIPRRRWPPRRRGS